MATILHLYRARHPRPLYLPLDQRARNHEAPHELTPSQQQSGVMAGWCFLTLIGFVIFGIALELGGWIVGLAAKAAGL